MISVLFCVSDVPIFRNTISAYNDGHLYGVTAGCSVQTAVPSLQDVQMLALRSSISSCHQQPAALCSLSLSLYISLIHECILFTDINQRRQK
jgi:hypothetical protein